MKERLILLFDVDDTLLDFAKSEREACSRMLKALGSPVTEQKLKDYSAINLRCWKLYEEGKIDRSGLDAVRMRIFFEKYGIDADITEAAALYRGFMSESAFLADGSAELLKKLAVRDRLFIVSNGDEATQKKRLKKAGIDGFFEDKFYSGAIGAAKPSPKFFDRVKESIAGYDADAALLIGDSLSSDIKGAENAGISCIWFSLPGRASECEKPDGYSFFGKAVGFCELEREIERFRSAGEPRRYG